MKKCLLLTRVSTKYQDFTPQEVELKEYANKQGYEVVGIISTKESGFRSIEKKDGFRQVKEFFAANSDCRTLIITELSRLSRYNSVLGYIQEYFESNKIQLIVKDIPFRLFNDKGELNDPTGMTFSMFSALASAEMKQKRERFQRAKKALREEGCFVGGKALFGYRIIEIGNKRKALEINQPQADLVRKVFDMYLNGMSIHKIRLECIAKGYDKYLHTASNIQKCLRETAYIGTKTTKNKRKNYQYFELGKTNVEKYITTSYTYSYFPPIVNEEVFNRVQELLTFNCPEKTSKHISILAKLLYVAECDCCLTAEVKKVNSAYACKRECKFQHACGKKRYSTSREILDRVVWSYVRENAEMIEQEQVRNLNTESIVQLEEEIENLRIRIQEKEKGKAKESSLFRAEAITEEEMIFKVAKLNKDIEGFKVAIKNKEAEIESIREFIANKMPESVADIISAAEGNPAEMKKYVNRFIKKIVIHLSDRYHSILEVIPKKYMGATKAQSFVVPVIDEDEDGNIIDGGYEEVHIQDMSFEVNDSDYIVIDKKRKLAYAIDNTIQAHSVKYNRDKRCLIYANNYDWDVLLSADSLTGFFVMSQSPNDKIVRKLKESYNINFKPLVYR